MHQAKKAWMMLGVYLVVVVFLVGFVLGIKYLKTESEKNQAPRPVAVADSVKTAPTSGDLK
ncbi:MAG: hypothetical protein WC822_02595 [Candidatus Paceibacterota bacterium]|jgi:hypothetical protein